MLTKRHVFDYYEECVSLIYFGCHVCGLSTLETTLSFMHMFPCCSTIFESLSPLRRHPRPLYWRNTGLHQAALETYTCILFQRYMERRHQISIPNCAISFLYLVPSLLPKDVCMPLSTLKDVLTIWWKDKCWLRVWIAPYVKRTMRQLPIFSLHVPIAFTFRNYAEWNWASHWVPLDASWMSLWWSPQASKQRWRHRE